MGMTIVEKIISEHLVSGELVAGAEVGIKIDQTLTQDATGTMAYLEFEAMGIGRVRNELAVSYVDHNTIQVGSENADDHAFLQSVAAKYGIVFSKAGNGICHQLHLERFGIPGKTLLGSDSHTPTGGGLGMLAIGAGGLDVATAMGGQPFFLTMPRVVKVQLKGSLRPWVTAKDVILKALEIFTVKGNVNTVLEYGGPGLKHLDVFERATITNMGAESGVTTSVFPSDEQTKAFLEAQGRGSVWKEICADPDAKYDRVVEINLADIEPLAAKPHSPGNISAVNSLSGIKVSQVLIGSCTNSSYRDLKTVAKILQGKKVSESVSLGIAPGSRQVLAMLANEGLLSVLIDAGARILENACGFCIGNSMSPATDSVSLRTSNRNFEGRTGTKSARVYLVSPEIAAVSAIYGRIVDPRTIDGLECPRVRPPKTFHIDDSMFVSPPGDGSSVEIVRGPNIGKVPEFAPLPSKVEGIAVIKVGDKITTDHIMPAGERLKYRSNVGQYSKYMFEGIDPEFSSRARAVREKGWHGFVVAGESYGQGSSREHAALCAMYLGIRVVIARSIERIHHANLVNFGIVPLTFKKARDVEKIEQGDKLLIANVRDMISGNGKGAVRNESKQTDIEVELQVTDRQKEILLRGGLLGKKE